MREDEIISDQEIDRVHAHANFGDMDKRDVVRNSVLKVASGLHIGYTAQTIVFEHGLVDSTDRRPTLTDLGRKYLWASMKQHVK
jgi:hypothetical protein